MAKRIVANKHTPKNVLLEEARLQNQMLKNLGKWFNALLLLSGIGIVGIWWGCSGESLNVLPAALGGLLAALCVVGMLFVRYALQKGRSNVAKIVSLAAEAKK